MGLPDYCWVGVGVLCDCVDVKLSWTNTNIGMSETIYTTYNSTSLGIEHILKIDKNTYKGF